MPATPGVPFLFVSATSFQSMWYGVTAASSGPTSRCRARRPARRAEILEVLQEAKAEAGLAGPLPARGAPSLLAGVADPGPAG